MAGDDVLAFNDKVEIILRVSGFTKVEIGEMSETEIYRKAFSAMSLVEELVSGIFGGGDEKAPTPSDYSNPYASVNPFESTE